MEPKCGCVVTYTHGGSRIGQINRCPLHQAAPELANALMGIIKVLDALGLPCGIARTALLAAGIEPVQDA